MKFVGYLLSLRRPFSCRSGILSSSIAANDFNFPVGKQPGFDGFLPTVWDYEGLLEVLSTLNRLFRAWSSARSFRSACREALL